jgi:predicted nucleotidyltransferase
VVDSESHMTLSSDERERLKREVAERLSAESEVCRVVVFGSFVTSPTPHDLDVAVFQESDEDYLPLALKYRRLLRSVAATIPVDVLPLRARGAVGEFLKEVERGEVVYVR